jgi:hypothetical protein
MVIGARKFSTNGSVALRKPSLRTAAERATFGLVVDENAQSQGDFEPRTKRTVDETMDISLLSKDSQYEV